MLFKVQASHRDWKREGGGVGEHCFGSGTTLFWPIIISFVVSKNKRARRKRRAQQAEVFIHQQGAGVWTTARPKAPCFPPER